MCLCKCTVVDGDVIQAESGAASAADTTPCHERYSIVTQLCKSKEIFTEASRQ